MSVSARGVDRYKSVGTCLEEVGVNACARSGTEPCTRVEHASVKVQLCGTLLRFVLFWSALQRFAPFGLVLVKFNWTEGRKEARLVQ